MILLKLANLREKDEELKRNKDQVQSAACGYKALHSPLFFTLLSD